MLISLQKGEQKNAPMHAHVHANGAHRHVCTKCTKMRKKCLRKNIFAQNMLLRIKFFCASKQMCLIAPIKIGKHNADQTDSW